MLSKKVLEEKVARLVELEAIIKEYEAEQKELEDGLKAEMERRKVEELSVGARMVRYTTYVQNRFDSSGFKKEHPNVYAAWQKQVTGHRFTVA